MAVTNIPDDHHVVRHCKNRLLIRVNGEITSVYPELFHLRSASDTRSQELYLSAVYYEHFAGDDAARMCACLSAMTFKPKPKDGMSRLNVGRIKQQGVKVKKALRVTHEPKKTNPAYAAIRGIPVQNDDELSGLLATLAVIETLEVSQL